MDNITTVTLEKLEFGIRQVLSKHFLDMQFKVKAESLFSDIIVSIRGFIWSTQHQHVEIEYPRDWWQAFKERWFGPWLLKRWPVEYKRHVLDIKALYPNFRPIPDQEYRLRIFREESG